MRFMFLQADGVPSHDERFGAAALMDYTEPRAVEVAFRNGTGFAKQRIGQIRDMVPIEAVV